MSRYVWMRLIRYIGLEIASYDILSEKDCSRCGRWFDGWQAGGIGQVTDGDKYRQGAGELRLLA